MEPEEESNRGRKGEVEGETETVRGSERERRITKGK